MKHLPDLTDSAIDTVVRIKKDALAPNSLNNFFAAYDLRALLNEQQKDLHRDALQLERTPVAGKLVGLKIDLEIVPELDRRLDSDGFGWQAALLQQPFMTGHRLGTGNPCHKNCPPLYLAFGCRAASLVVSAG